MSGEDGITLGELGRLGHLLVELDEDGRPESVNYDRVGVALIPWLRDLAARLAALEAGA